MNTSAIDHDAYVVTIGLQEDQPSPITPDELALIGGGQAVVNTI